MLDYKLLINKAIEAQAFSYSPYSNFRVGAALLAKGGAIYTGCNVESAAYSPTSCAERNAFCNAISYGEREFEAIAIVGGKADKPVEYCAPCGVCRQVMMEFCNPDTFEIIMAKSPEDYKVFTLAELLPMGFGKDNL